MCRIFKIIYVCGHTDVVKGPCEWRDEGRIDVSGRRVQCEKSFTNVADLSRLCMACTTERPAQDLVILRSPMSEYNMDSYIAYDEKDIMATVVRNESYLRKRARIPNVISTPPISLGFPMPSELHYRFCTNEKFLARRLKRRTLQRHFDERGEFQDFVEAHDAFLDASAALDSSISTVDSSGFATASTEGVQKAADRIKRASIVTETNEGRETPVRPSHPFPSSSSDLDDSSRTIIPSMPHAPSNPFSIFSTESDGSADWIRTSLNQDSMAHQTYDNLQEIDDMQEDDNIQPVTHERDLEPLIPWPGRRGRSSSIELAGEDYLGQEHSGQESLDLSQFVEWSTFIGDLNDEFAQRGTGSPELSMMKIALDSAEGIARLADIRLFLGMRPDTEPLDIWRFALRNADLIENIEASTVRIRHRRLGLAKRSGFNRDPGINTVLDFSDEKWELGKGFVEVWNSLYWPFDQLEGSGPDNSASSSDENSSDDDMSDIDKLNLTLGADDLIPIDVDVGDLNVEDEPEREEVQEQGNHARQRTVAFQLEGSLANMPFEVGFSGRPRTPRHQARNASGLRMSWTYADLDNPATSWNSQSRTVSPLPLPVTFSTLRDEPLAPVSSHPILDPSQNVSTPPLPPPSLSRIALHDDTTPVRTLSLEGIDQDVAGPATSPSSDDTSSSGSDSLRTSERDATSALIQADSPTGQDMLSELRKLLAMPESKTPLEISLYIDNHTELIQALRTGYVPLPKPQKPVRSSRLRTVQQRADAFFKPLKYVLAHCDVKQFIMRGHLISCLRVLDWDEIDSSPVPFPPSSSPLPWARYGSGVAGGDHLDHVEEDDEEKEEECDRWVRTTIPPIPNRLAKGGAKYLVRHRVKIPSPLRTMFTRRDPVRMETDMEREEEEEVIMAAPTEQEEESVSPLSEAGEGDDAAAGGDFFSRHGDAYDSFAPEVWDEVDLGDGVPRSFLGC